MAATLNVLTKLLLAVAVGGGIAYSIGRGRWEGGARRNVAIAIGAIMAVGTYWVTGTTEKLETTARGVVVSILASALLFLGANKLFDLAQRRWTVYTTVLGFGSTTSIFLILWGNRAIDDPVARTIVAAIIGTAAGYLLGTVEAKWTRLGVGVGAGALLGALAASGMRKVILVFVRQGDDLELWPILPNINYGELIAYTLVGGAVGAGLWHLRGRRKPIERPLIFWASVGFFIGAWVTPRLGTGTKEEAILGAIGLGVGLGALAGLKPISRRPCSRSDRIPVAGVHLPRPCPRLHRCHPRGPDTAHHLFVVLRLSWAGVCRPGQLRRHFHQ